MEFLIFKEPVLPGEQRPVYHIVASFVTSFIYATLLPAGSIGAARDERNWSGYNKRIMRVNRLFEEELRNRRIEFEIEPESGRYSVAVGETNFLISLENLTRDFDRVGDPAIVSRFVDTIETTAIDKSSPLALGNLYWALEPNDHVEKADILEPISDRVDRVLVYLSSDGSQITWVNKDMLTVADVSVEDALKIGYQNLAKALTDSRVEYTEIDEVRLGMIETSLPFKASLVLAPNLREVVEAEIGWPLTAVTPNRDFLYLWASRHTEFVSRVGAVVVQEFTESSYPITTEVFEISDNEINAIGEFPV